MSSPEIINFANELRDQLRRYMNDITDSLATGSAKTFEQYQRQIQSPLIFRLQKEKK